MVCASSFTGMEYSKGKSVAEAVRSSLAGASIDSLDKDSVNRLKQQGLESARNLQRRAALTAADVRASDSAKEAITKVWVACIQFNRSSAAAALARTLICAYFLNLCIEDLENWWWVRADRSIACGGLCSPEHQYCILESRQLLSQSSRRSFSPPQVR